MKCPGEPAEQVMWAKRRHDSASFLQALAITPFGGLALLVSMLSLTQLESAQQAKTTGMPIVNPHWLVWAVCGGIWLVVIGLCLIGRHLRKPATAIITEHEAAKLTASD